MGVPKFFKWISERYPCISQVVNDDQIPSFDNFYLDMNGIIHNCSHDDSFFTSCKINEKEIFENVFSYVDFLFQIIKPKKLFFLAVDGVAPRAKMNQQRSRRFRSVQEKELAREKILKKNNLANFEDAFDSNCITPEFLQMEDGKV
jgi:5'-3' exoribonuclease 1